MTQDTLRAVVSAAKQEWRRPRAYTTPGDYICMDLFAAFDPETLPPDWQRDVIQEWRVCPIITQDLSVEVSACSY